MSHRSAGSLVERLRESVDAVRERTELEPAVGLVLGTGLGGVAERIDVEAEVPYESIPHFGRVTVETHAGRLLLGRLEGVPVAALDGRLHRYEGHSMERIAHPIRALGLLGARTLLLSGAAGGLDPLWSPGELVLLDDHLNLMGESPLTGPNADELGPRFPDMSEPYDRTLQEVALEAALDEGIPLHRGVYAAVAGPQLETRAEYRMLRRMGADVVGMSTVPEVIAARHMGLRVLVTVIVTDACLPDALEPVDVPEILRIAGEAEPRLTRVLLRVVRRIGEEGGG